MSPSGGNGQQEDGVRTAFNTLEFELDAGFASLVGEIDSFRGHEMADAVAQKRCCCRRHWWPFLLFLGLALPPYAIRLGIELGTQPKILKLDEQCMGDQERIEAERIEAERIEAERIEAERIEAERIEAERIEIEAERVEAQRIEAERIEAERIEAERIEAERIEAERIESERIEAERIEAERIEAERLEAERVEAERVEAERIEAERIEAEAERVEVERIESERVEAGRIEAESIVDEAAAAEEARLEGLRLQEAGGTVTTNSGSQYRLGRSKEVAGMENMMRPLRKKVDRREAERIESPLRVLVMTLKDASVAAVEVSEPLFLDLSADLRATYEQVKAFWHERLP